MLEAAIAYAELGWPILPLEPRGKIPMTQHGQKDATCNREMIERFWLQWPESNIGLHLGPISVLHH